MFDGHTVVAPSQFSAGSHGPVEERHTTLAAAGVECVHALLAHTSTEQTLLSVVQAWPSRVGESSGHVNAPPQVSAGSHTLPSVLARQTVFAGAGASAGHAELPVGQVSAASQMPFDVRQVVPTGLMQLPRLPATLHAWQSFGSPLPHTVPQQTPSMQLLLVH